MRWRPVRSKYIQDRRRPHSAYELTRGRHTRRFFPRRNVNRPRLRPYRSGFGAGGRW